MRIANSSKEGKATAAKTETNKAKSNKSSSDINNDDQLNVVLELTRREAEQQQQNTKHLELALASSKEHTSVIDDKHQVNNSHTTPPIGDRLPPSSPLLSCPTVDDTPVRAADNTSTGCLSSTLHSISDTKLDSSVVPFNHPLWPGDIFDAQSEFLCRCVQAALLFLLCHVFSLLLSSLSIATFACFIVVLAFYFASAHVV